MWLIQDSNWKGRALWRLSGGLATILQNWISCNEQKMREAHITRRETSFYLFMIFIEKISNRKLKHSLSVIHLELQEKSINHFLWHGLLKQFSWCFTCYGVTLVENVDALSRLFVYGRLAFLKARHTGKGRLRLQEAGDAFRLLRDGLRPVRAWRIRTAAPD